MNQFTMRITVTALALALTAGMALANHEDVKKKRRGLFGGFFSSNDDRDKLLARRRAAAREGWYSNDEPWGFWNRSPRLGFSKKKPSRRFIDPEGNDPGLGMGNLTYVADKMVALGGVNLKQPRPGGAVEAAIYDALAGTRLGIRTLPEIRQVMLDYYQQTNFHPVWLENGRLSARAEAVLKILAAADDEGLQSVSYLPPALSGFAAARDIAPGDSETLARFDLGLTAMALKYARDASGGVFDPRRLSRYNDIAPERASMAQVMKVFGWSPAPDSYLIDLQPRHPAFVAMKSTLADLRKKAAEKTFVPILTGKKVKVGQADLRLAAIRDRLAVLGMPVDPAIGDDPALLNLSDASALKQLQKSAGIKETGILDDTTVNALNGDNTLRDIRRITTNMERMRWLPRNLGARHVMVNQAAFLVRVMDGRKEVWRSKVIVGKPNTQTAAFNDEIETVVFNPSWGVPPSIIANEYLPKLWRDPGYLDRIGFRVTTLNGKKLSSRSINWDAYGSKVPFNIEQPPGADNALGEIKFLFPNAHNIYMHDTPNRELFANEVRTFSHGCVRVENPREYAMVLLGWDRAKVDEFVDDGVSKTVRLEKKVPIHITYFTAWPDESGKIQFYSDVYGRDAAMEKALTATTVAER